MMKRLLLAAMLWSITTSAWTQISSIGLIGDATPGGWDVDTNLVQSSEDSAIWTLTILLQDGNAKFRANDDWVINWGSEDFPVGTGIQEGPNIPIDSGFYNIWFNSSTGDYIFSPVNDVMSIGLIGSATPGGWDADTNMIQDSLNDAIWTLAIDLIDGEAKFRADDDWAVNWGATDFPTGVGTQDGPNIPVFGGSYQITFNSDFGTYDFAVQSPVGIIGSATPNGWDEDVNMFQDQMDSNKFFITLDLVAGDAKFRLDDDWVVNWGAADFPTGVGTQDGPNIPIPSAGTYMVMLDTATGAYSFEEIVTYANVGIIGSATAGGWDTLTPLMRDADDPNLWSGSMTLTDGGAQFTANDGEFVWGASGFPTDTAVLDGDTIPVVAGEYIVYFNTATGIYDFQEVVIYESIGLIGSATPNGWEGDDIDMERSASDSSMWTLRMELLDGEAKFRGDNDWTTNWGSGDFPSGIATLNGANIPITAGDYLISFNSISGAYNFEAIVEYDAISLVGKSGPFGDWPGDDASNDLFLDKDPNDPQLWTAENVMLTSHMGADDEGVKFRADTAWTVNWGAADFPTGTGTQDGPNIVTVAGTYNVMFNSATGEYAFVDPATSSRDFLNPATIKLFPNPARDRVYLDMSATELNGDILLRIFDLDGKLLMERHQQIGPNIEINVGMLKSGNYLMQLTNAQIIIGKQFTIVE